ncbi:unnamed protein product [Albugo candida]|uniref:Integrase zinc-binding domain-containing protein n=1 Tax=Albugo candida TaxID=65357 RepID=A0A024GTG8_9STRA|nr:unnamed protein product [Albugo candida]|eukprot:CCI49870.1 unnamed protein product [Albugo candida]
MGDIVRAQQAAKTQMYQLLDGVTRTKSGKIWIPDEVSELQVRLCVVAHFDIGGHRGVDVTTQNVSDLHDWKTLKQDVQMFVRQCLRCSATEVTVLRALGEGLHGTKPNDLLHWYNVYIGNSNTSQRYILVLKDDAFKYVWLNAVADGDALSTREVLLDWFASFGICYR